MRVAAREYYLRTHTPEKNYLRLIEIYQNAIASTAVRELLPA
jgi:hypothetical protein